MHNLPLLELRLQQELSQKLATFTASALNVNYTATSLYGCFNDIQLIRYKLYIIHRVNGFAQTKKFQANPSADRLYDKAINVMENMPLIDQGEYVELLEFFTKIFKSSSEDQ